VGGRSDTGGVRSAPVATGSKEEEAGQFEMILEGKDGGLFSRESTCSKIPACSQICSLEGCMREFVRESIKKRAKNH